MGENKLAVVNTGCPSMDLAREVLQSPDLDFNPILKYGGVGESINWEEGVFSCYAAPCYYRV